jgi:hypothetical protein
MGVPECFGDPFKKDSENIKGPDCVDCTVRVDCVRAPVIPGLGEPTLPERAEDKLDNLTEEIKDLTLQTKRNFYEIGKRLKIIRDEKLYEARGYTSFTTYCECELDYSRRTAYRFIGIVENFTPQMVEGKSLRALLEEIPKKGKYSSSCDTRVTTPGPEHIRKFPETPEKPVQAEFQRVEENQESGEDEQPNGMDREEAEIRALEQILGFKIDRGTGQPKRTTKKYKPAKELTEDDIDYIRLQVVVLKDGREAVVRDHYPGYPHKQAIIDQVRACVEKDEKAYRDDY